MSKQIEKVEGLNIQLHGVDIAVIAHYAGGKQIALILRIYPSSPSINSDFNASGEEGSSPTFKPNGLNTLLRTSVL